MNFVSKAESLITSELFVDSEPRLVTMETSSKQDEP